MNEQLNSILSIDSIYKEELVRIQTEKEREEKMEKVRQADDEALKESRDAYIKKKLLEANNVLASILAEPSTFRENLQKTQMHLITSYDFQGSLLYEKQTESSYAGIFLVKNQFGFRIEAYQSKKEPAYPVWQFAKQLPLSLWEPILIELTCPGMLIRAITRAVW